MKLSCEVIRDLLPLYAEGLLSDDSTELVRCHIKECGDCKKELETMNKETSENQENSTLITDTGPLKKIRRKIFYGKMKWTLLSILGSMVMAILLVTYITAPNYLPYDEERVAMIEGADNKVYLEFGEDVSGYDIERSVSTTDNTSEYRITTWDTLWSRTFGRTESSMIVLNPEGHNVRTIFYYTTDGQMDQVIYGINPYPDGGSMTLPRLALNYYVTLAVFSLILSLILRKLFQKKRMMQRFFEVIAILSGSYVLSHGMLHGLSGTSYSILRDFTGIMILAMTIFVTLLVVQSILRAKRETYT